MARKSSPKKSALKPRFRVVCGNTIALGPGKVELLEALVQTGSLNEAAARLDMSYMRAWTLVKTMNKCFREPVAIAERGGKTGGGMTVTKSGLAAISLYREIEIAAAKASADSWRHLEKLLCA